MHAIVRYKYSCKLKPLSIRKNEAEKRENSDRKEVRRIDKDDGKRDRRYKKKDEGER